MLGHEDIKKATILDNAAAEVGGYLDTSPSGLRPYRIRDMHKYCKDHGKDIEKLTPAERDRFRVEPKTKVL